MDSQNMLSTSIKPINTMNEWPVHANRAVVDTMVLAHAYDGEGVSREALNRIGKYMTFYLSQDILGELGHTMTLEMGYSKTEAEAYSQRLQRMAAPIVVPGKVHYNLCEDKHDWHILKLAEKTQSKWVISSDEELVKMDGWHGIRVLHPADFNKLQPGDFEDMRPTTPTTLTSGTAEASEGRVTLDIVVLSHVYEGEQDRRVREKYNYRAEVASVERIRREVSSGKMTLVLSNYILNAAGSYIASRLKAPPEKISEFLAGIHNLAEMRNLSRHPRIEELPQENRIQLVVGLAQQERVNTVVTCHPLLLNKGSLGTVDFAHPTFFSGISKIKLEGGRYNYTRARCGPAVE